MRATNIECNMCGNTLRGRKGQAFINKEHLGFKGLFTGQLVDENGMDDHYFISMSPMDEHHFCGWACLKDFADLRRQGHEKRRMRELRGEAGGGRLVVIGDYAIRILRDYRLP